MNTSTQLSYGEDESGVLELGFFYELVVLAENDEDIPEETSDWYSSLSDDDLYVMPAVVSRKHTKLHRCSANSKHVTGRRHDELLIRWSGGGTRSMMLASDYYILFDDDLRKRLASTDLKGTECIEAKIELVPPITERPNKIFQPQFPGIRPLRKPTFQPNIPNACPFCKHGPLFCNVCGTLEFFMCPKCEKRCIAKRRASSPGQIHIRPTPEQGQVLDAAKWDGNDFCDGIVTRRALDFLLQIHATSFKAQPLRTYFGNCDKNSEKRIKSQVTRPVVEAFE